MAIADEIAPGELYNTPALHKPAATGGPENTSTPVTAKPVTIFNDIEIPKAVDTTPKPESVSLAPGAIPGPVEEPKAKEKVTFSEPAIPGRVEFDPAVSVTNDKPAEPTAKKSKTAKEVSDQATDLMSEGLTNIKNMAEGGDPAIQAQFNSWLNKFATSSASARSALMMNLRSQPGFVAGSGEGTAAMLMMARQSETTLADMQSKMSIANLQFMADANKLGIEKAIQVRQFLNEQESHDLQNQISELNIAQGKQNLEQGGLLNEQTLELNRQSLLNNELDTLKTYGQYDKIAEILNKKYPGLAVSSAAIRSADPVTLNAMTGQKNAIAALVESGNAEGAKAQAIGYYSQFWQNEGFKSQEEAIAYANKLDFSAAAFAARSAYIESTSTAVRNYAVRNDSSAGKAAVVDYYKAIGRDPASVGGTLSVEQVNEMRKYLDPTSQPVADLAAEDKGQLGIDWEWYQQKKGAAGANTVGAVYNSFAEAAKNAGTPFDADQEKMVKAWVNQKLTYGDLASDVNAPNGYTISDKATLLPWDDPKTSFYFTTWPKYDFSGETPELMDAGGQRYSSINSTNYGANTAAEDKRLDDAYLAYMHSPAYDPTMTREKWYFESKGGTTEVKKVTPVVATGTGNTLTSALNKTDQIMGSLPAKVDPAFVKGQITAAAKGTYTGVDISNKLSRYPGAAALGIRPIASGGNYNPVAPPLAKDFMAYNNMVEHGVPPAQAAELIIEAIGAERFKAAFKALVGREWTGVG